MTKIWTGADGSTYEVISHPFQPDVFRIRKSKEGKKEYLDGRYLTREAAADDIERWIEEGLHGQQCVVDRR